MLNVRKKSQKKLLKMIKELKELQNQAFVLRIKNNVTLEMLGNGNYKVDKDGR